MTYNMFFRGFLSRRAAPSLRRQTQIAAHAVSYKKLCVVLHAEMHDGFIAYVSE